MNIQEEQNRIIHEFSHLNDWLDKYQHLIELGKNHSSLNDAFKTDRYALAGCQSKVWIIGELMENRLRIRADSDSMITRGILALLIRVLNNRPPQEIAAAKLFFVEDIGLSTNLSPSRANGLALIIKTIRDIAQNHLNKDE